MEKEEFNEKSKAIRENMENLLKKINENFTPSEYRSELLSLQMIASAIIQTDMAINDMGAETALDVYDILLQIFNYGSEQFYKAQADKNLK